MSVIAVIFFGLCVTSVWAECGTCDKESQCAQEPTASDCEFGLVKDACNCCLQCAKGVGETCGTRNNAGICAPGLICKLVSPRQPSRCDEDPNAADEVVIQEVPADATDGENIQDAHTPEEERPVGNLTPNRNHNADAGEAQSAVGQGSRDGQVRRPIRGQLSQSDPEQNERTQEDPSEAESEPSVHAKSDAEPEVTSQDTPVENNQEEQAPGSTVQRGNQGLRGNGQNTRTRGNVPVERVSATQSPQNDETESHSRGNAPGRREPTAQAQTQEVAERQAEGDQVQAVTEAIVEGQDEHDQIVASMDAAAATQSATQAKQNAEGQNDQNNPNHTLSEAEEQGSVVRSGQNRRTEEASSSGSTNNQARSQPSRQTSRSRQTRQLHNERTVKHNHEGSLKNLDEEDLNENFTHDNPKFDNRTS